MPSGRKTLLTPKLQAKLCSFIRRGTYDYVAAQAVGINRATLCDWIERGDAEKIGIYAEFSRAVAIARDDCRARAEIEVRTADPKWWLSRMYKDRPGEPGWSDPAIKADLNLGSTGLSIHIHPYHEESE